MVNILIREFEPGSVVDQTALEQFQKQWSTYQKLVDADALSHKAVGNILHDALTETFAKAVTRRPESADTAWCGLSIHHLRTEEKLALLKAIRGSTSRLVMIYEPTLAEGGTREGYLEPFRAVNRPPGRFLPRRNGARSTTM
jgi:hypothetical protein